MVEKFCTSGACMKVTTKCTICEASYLWSNAENSEHFNAMLCGSILFTGAIPSAIKK